MKVRIHNRRRWGAREWQEWARLGERMGDGEFGSMVGGSATRDSDCVVLYVGPLVSCVAEAELVHLHLTRRQRVLLARPHKGV